NPATTKKWCRSGSGSKLKAAQKRGYLTCRPLFKNAPAAFLRARFLGAMRILSADQRSDSLTSMEIAPRKKCLRTSGLKAIMTSLPAAASHSDFRRRSHPDCRATIGVFARSERDEACSRAVSGTRPRRAGEGQERGQAPRQVLPWKHRGTSAFAGFN